MHYHDSSDHAHYTFGLVILIKLKIWNHYKNSNLDVTLSYANVNYHTFDPFYLKFYINVPHRYIKESAQFVLVFFYFIL